MSIEDEEVAALNVRPTPRSRNLRSRASSKLKWNNVSIADSDRPKSASLKVQDYEPAFALRKIALLYEKKLNEEVAHVIREISLGTLRKIYLQFPIDMFIEGIPHTLSIVSILYSRLLSSAQLNGYKVDLPYKSLLIKLVKLQARNLDKSLPKVKYWEKHDAQCDSLLQVIGRTQGTFCLKMLRNRKRRLEAALENFTEHQMISVETSLIDSEIVDNQLLPLPIAFRVELDRMMNNCKISMNKLNRDNRRKSSTNNKRRMSSSTAAKMNILGNIDKKTSLNNDLRMDSFNHQRLLNFTTKDVEDRLYKNKELLNVVEPTMHYAQLPKLVDILQERINKDKEILSTFYDLRNDVISVSSEARLLPQLKNYEEAYSIIISTLKNYAPDDSTESLSTNDSNSRINGSANGSNSYGKFSNNSSNIMDCQSNNGSSLEVKDVEKTANRNSEVASTNASSDSSKMQKVSSPPKGLLEARIREELDKKNELLKAECVSLRHQLEEANKVIEKTRTKEVLLMNRLPQIASRSSTPRKQTDQSQAAQLAAKFASLYSRTCMEALDTLEQTWEDGQSESVVKSKVLFAIIVVSFRSAADTLDRARYELRNLIGAPTCDDEQSVVRLEKHFNQFLVENADTYDLTSNVESVCDQICDVLYDHPRLASSDKFRSYVQACVRLSWKLAVHTPALGIDYDSELFDPMLHKRFPTSDPTSDNVVCFLWPALVFKETGQCVSHGLVITG